MKPNSRPQAKKEDILKYIPDNILKQYKIILVGVRGYYLDSMGKPNQNDRGMYDDAIFIVSDDKFVSFNANTDPSRFSNGIALLNVGVHLYKKGLHGISKKNPYPALRPATPNEGLPVTRDGRGQGVGIAINIHKGSLTTTSSLGCQTLYPTQWKEFIDTVYLDMDKYDQKIIPYVLVEQA